MRGCATAHVFNGDQMGVHAPPTDGRFGLSSSGNPSVRRLSLRRENNALDVNCSLLRRRRKRELDARGHVALYINFDFNKADIRPDSRPIIDEVTKLLRDNPDLRLTVEGHTDNVGTPAYNLNLSDARARSVVAALTAQGIEARRLKSAGYGQERPIADNGTDDGRAKNRRVELVKMG